MLHEAAARRSVRPQRGSELTDHGVNRIVRTAALRAGLPDAEQYTAHSLRAGGLVDALARGVPRGIAARHEG